MMRHLIYIFAICLLVDSSYSQTEKKAEDWRRYAPTALEFSVDTPLVMQHRGLESQGSQSYSVEINGVYLYVFAEDIQSKEYFDTVRGTLFCLGQSRDAISLDSSAPISFKDQFGYWQTLRTFKTDARIYIAQSVSLDENSEIALRFIKSFGRGDQPSIVPKPAGSKKSSVEKSATVTKGDKTNEKPSGLESVVAAAFQPPTHDYTSGIKVLTKPRPGYTDLARIYGISGTIKLEVEFLGSGEIGTITPVTQLPFGLTQTSIEAAKRITFQPAYENGAPITLTKKIEYSYAIY